MDRHDDIGSANSELLEHLSQNLAEGGAAIGDLRRKLGTTYWVLIVLSVIMFGVGIALLAVPLVFGFSGVSGGKVDQWQLPLTAGGLGLADLVTLFFFRPMKRIQKLMADFSQLTLVLNSYQCRVGLRLLESQLDKRETVGEAAVHVREAAESSLALIHDYFEVDPVAKPDEPDPTGDDGAGGDDEARESASDRS